MQFPFELAGPADDADLRHVLAATPMEGRMAVSFQREPSWFGGAVVDGFFRQVVACRDLVTGHILGFGCRSLRRLYVNGMPVTVGYLSSLRVLPQYRNLGLVARGYAFFCRLHQDGLAPFYLTTIAEGNEPALRMLTSGRAGLPQYHPAGEYHTLAITLPRRRRHGPTLSSVRPASISDLPAILAFLKQHGPRKQYFPVYGAEDFLADDGLLRGLGVERILLAERAGQIAGILGGWDQHAYRQHIVHHYSGWLRYVRPLYNLTAWARGLAGLPPPGQPLRTVMAALPLVADDDEAIFSVLLSALRDYCGGGPWTHLLLGLHERDPLLPVARSFESGRYTSRLFLACWPDGDAARLAVDARPPYLEAGSL